MKKYKLKLWYPSLPRDWEVGDIFEYNPQLTCYIPLTKEYKYRSISSVEAETNPTFWEEVKELLLVTEDGIKIKEGINFWLVTKDFELKYWDSFVMDTIQANIPYLSNKKLFSTKELAQEYIDQNKPIFSKKQIKEAIYISLKL